MIPFYADPLPALTTPQMVEVDRAMMEDYQIGLIQMMENAGRNLAHLATLGEEVHEPKVTIPRAIVIALGTAALLYAAVALVAVAGVGAGAMAGTSSPLERAAAAFTLPGVGLVIGLGAVTAMLGVLLSQILGISRMAFAMARRLSSPAAWVCWL
jgi:L-asparagine transporter-like permease